MKRQSDEFENNKQTNDNENAKDLNGAIQSENAKTESD